MHQVSVLWEQSARYGMKTNYNDFNIKDNDEVEAKFYTSESLKDYSDGDDNPRLRVENSNVFAKAIKSKPAKHFNNARSDYRYYVKVDASKILYDPTVKYVAEKTKPSFIDKVCRGESVFIEVVESVFNKYVLFLKSGNKQQLTNAQRDIK